VKFALYDAAKDERCLFRGQIEGIGLAPRLKVADAGGRVIEEREFAAQGFDHDAAMREIVTTGRTLLEGGSVAAFGHRVVHGGVNYDAPVPPILNPFPLALSGRVLFFGFRRRS
jgi:acetate kinase